MKQLYEHPIITPKNQLTMNNSNAKFCSSTNLDLRNFRNWKIWKNLQFEITKIACKFDRWKCPSQPACPRKSRWPGLGRENMLENKLDEIYEITSANRPKLHLQMLHMIFDILHKSLRFGLLMSGIRKLGIWHGNWIHRLNRHFFMRRFFSQMFINFLFWFFVQISFELPEML